MARRALCLLGALAVLLGTWTAPSDAHPERGRFPCSAAVSLLKEGNLSDAADVARAVGPVCVKRIERRSNRATQIATRLANRAARQSDPEEKERLLGLAFAFDAANARAVEVKGKDEEPAPKPDLCSKADAARERGEYALAEALYDAQAEVEGAKECVAAGTVALAEARAKATPTRVRGWFTDDAWPLLLLMLVFFAVGVVGAGMLRVRGGWRVAWLAVGTTVVLGVAAFFATQGTFRWATDREFFAWTMTLVLIAAALVISAIAGSRLVTVLLIAAVVAAALFEAAHLGRPYFDGTLVGATLIGSLLSGFLMSTAARCTAPMRIEVTGEGGKDLPALVIAKLHALGEAPASGVYAMAGTDLTSSGVTGALEQVGNPVAKVILDVWNTILRGSASRAVVSVTDATATAPCSVTVTLAQGTRTTQSASVEGTSFLVDASAPTAGELAHSADDVATGIAAQILLWRLDARVEPRLYGATKSLSVALAAAASKRFQRHDAEGAAALYGRAVDVDPDNRAARFDYASLQVRQYPDEVDARPWIEQLKDLVAVETKEGPSPLLWRLRYNFAAAHANVAMANVSVPAGMATATFDVADLSEAREQLRKLARRHMPGAAPRVIRTDRDLYRRLSAMARAAVAGFDAAGNDPGRAQKAAKMLDERPLTVSFNEQLNVVGGLAIAARSASVDNDVVVRQKYADHAVRRLRIAGGDEARRATLLKDPFVKLLHGFSSYDELAADWTTSPYEGLSSFGKIAAQVAAEYPDPADLVAAPATSLVTKFDVDAETSVAWRGAAEWLERDRSIKDIELIQRAGYPDRASLAAAITQTVAPARVAATAKLLSRDLTQAELSEILVEMQRA